MKTHVNLYQASCQPQKTHFNFKQLLLMLLIGAGLSIVITLSSLEVIKRGAIRVIEAENTLLTLENQFTSLVENNLNEHPKQEHNKKRKALLDEIAKKQGLLAHLNDIDLTEKIPFPDVMLGITRSNKDYVSLTQLKMTSHKLSVKGKATKSALIPQWLMSMKKTPELAGMAFNNIDISQQSGGFIFHLNQDVLPKDGLK